MELVVLDLEDEDTHSSYQLELRDIYLHSSD